MIFKRKHNVILNLEIRSKESGFFKHLGFTGFLASLGFILAFALLPYSALAQQAMDYPAVQTTISQHDFLSPTTIDKFDHLILKAKAENWKKLSLGECIGKVASEFINTPYVANTLEADGPEVCRVNFAGLDCVTFFENSLCLARIIKKGESTINDLLKEITHTRYRSGIISDYASRLHYTADWISDNTKKNVVLDITKGIGGTVFPVRVSFMSKNPSYYKALTEHPELIPTISKIEKEINARIYYYIPKANIKSIEKFLKTGDIIAIATNKKGLDYSHTGLIYVSDGKPCFLHASSKEKKVILGPTISEYLKQSNSNIGITILRPIYKDGK